jgi:hypothetical protein
MVLGHDSSRLFLIARKSQPANVQNLNVSPRPPLLVEFPEAIELRILMSPRRLGSQIRNGTCLPTLHANGHALDSVALLMM